MKGKKWDVYVYGDVNIDLVVPGVSSLPKPGQEDEVPVMDTYVGGGAALFALGIGKLGLHPVFQGEVGDDCYAKNLPQKISTTVCLGRAGRKKPVFRSVLPMKRIGRF